MIGKYEKPVLPLLIGGWKIHNRVTKELGGGSFLVD